MSFRANDSDGYKSWLELSIEEIRSDAFANLLFSCLQFLMRILFVQVIRPYLFFFEGFLMLGS